MSQFVPRLVKILVVPITVFMILGCLQIPAGECSGSTNAQSAKRIDSSEVRYTVRKGDTLYAIASNHRVALRELMRVNNLDSSLIRPGEVYIIPQKTTANGNLSRGDISREELMLLARLIHAEARGESFEGQVAVGAVILNRIASPHFPKTISEVIFQKNKRVYQFSPVGDGSINLKPDEKAIQAAVQALSGKDPTQGALFFYNPEISSDKWIRTLPVMMRIGKHVFATCT